MDRLDELRSEWTTSEIKQLHKTIECLKWENDRLKGDVDALVKTNSPVMQRARVLFADSIVEIDNPYVPYRHIHYRALKSMFVSEGELPEPVKINEGSVWLRQVCDKDGNEIGAVGKCEECGKIFVWHKWRRPREEPVVLRSEPRISIEGWNDACSGLGTKIR